MKVDAALLTLALGSAAAALPQAILQQDTGPFVLSVLRRDGTVLPFATYDGKRWSKRWPQQPPADRPISLDDIPKSWWGVEPAPRAMSHWADGVKVGDVAVTALMASSPMCEPRMTLRSDYRAREPVPPGFVLPFPKDGVLVSSEVTVEKIATLDPAGDEAKGVLGLALDEFNRQETATASRFTHWSHPVKQADRRKVPVTLEAIYRAPLDDAEGTAYFIEAIRDYPPGPNERDGCGLTTYASGWVITGGGRASIRVGARITFCDRKGVGYMFPFGLLRADAKNYWIVQYSGFESESYEVVRPTRRNIEAAVIYHAGSCGR